MKTRAYFNDIEFQILRLIRGSVTEIKIVVAWLTSVEIFGELIEKALKNVNVKVVISNSEINFRDSKMLNKLRDSGAEVFVGRSTSPFLHHKFGIFDNKYLVNGSYNFTYSAKMNNSENIVLFEFDNNDEMLLTQFKIIFENIRVYHSELYTGLHNNVLVNEYNLLNAELDNVDLRLEFDRDINNAINTTERLGIKLNHDYLRRMITMYGGGVLLVKKIINDEMKSGVPKFGFIKLIENGHPELSLEHIALLPQYQSLFTVDELKFCSKMLRKTL